MRLPRIFRFFKRRKVPQNVNVYSKIPVTSAKDLQRVEWGRALLRQLHDLKVENLDYKAKEEQEDRDREQIKDRQNYEKQILQKQSQEAVQDRNKQFILKLDLQNSGKKIKRKPFPSHKTKHNRRWKKFYGIQVRTTDEGKNYICPVLIDNNNNIFPVPGAAVNDFWDLFKNELNIAEEVNSGLVETNIIFTEDKKVDIDITDPKAALIRKYYPRENPNQEIVVVDVNEFSQQKHELEMKKMEEEYNKIYHELEEANEKIIEYKETIKNQDTSNKLSSARGDAAEARLSAEEDKTRSMVANTAIMAGALMDMQFDKFTAERLGKKAWKKLKEAQDIMFSNMTQSERETMLNEIFNTAERFKKVKSTVTTPPPNPKEE